MSLSESPESRRQTVGALVLYAGIGLGGLVLLDCAYGLPWSMPTTWYLHRTLWGALALGACIGGWMLQRSPATRDRGWKPAVGGRRFRRLIVYSRSDCHLCDDAKAVLSTYLEYLPEIEEVDLETDPQLKERFGLMIPVVELDGVVRFHGRVDEVLLRRLIESTPPLE